MPGAEERLEDAEAAALREQIKELRKDLETALRARRTAETATAKANAALAEKQHGNGGDVDGGACCFTWIVKVNGQDGPKGISFYESDGAGKISYIRDIPATTPAPLQAIAALVNPELRVFSPRVD